MLRRRLWWALRSAAIEFLTAWRRRPDLDPSIVHSGSVIRQSDDRLMVEVTVDGMVVKARLLVGVQGLELFLEPGDPVLVGFFTRNELEPEAIVPALERRLAIYPAVPLSFRAILRPDGDGDAATATESN